MQLNICHLYPDVLNLYGDRGNLLCAQKRLQWRGIDCSVTELPIGAHAPLSDFDLFFIGGGASFAPALLDELAGAKGADIRAAALDGKAFLCVCGGFQLMGRGCERADGSAVELLGAADFYTKDAPTRLTGDYAFRLEEASGGSLVIGFENHTGRTTLGPDAAPLGRVLTGHGNNGADGTEGVRFLNVFGTYSHGPVLPKNPAFCDELLRCALLRRYGSAELLPLDDTAEQAARAVMLARLGLREG